MSHNPYSPPQATVDDVESQPSMVRPRAVVIAIWLFWTSLGIDIVSYWPEFLIEDPEFPLVAKVIVTAAMFGIGALLNVKMWQGRNWARIASLILTILAFAIYGLGMLVLEMDNEDTSELAMGWLDWVGTILYFVGLVLVFGAGRAWFRQRA